MRVLRLEPSTVGLAVSAASLCVYPGGAIREDLDG
jgi:hypothetical protein